MKAVSLFNVAMSDIFRAVAGAADSQFDMVACAVFKAATDRMQYGNKSQFAKLQEDANMYGGDLPSHNKACKAAIGVDKMTPAVKKFRKTYFAVSVALAQMPMPEDMQKDLPPGKANEVKRNAVTDPLAQVYADEFVSIFHAALTMPDKTDAELAEAKAKRADAKAAKDALAAEQAAQADEDNAAAIRAAAAEMVGNTALASVPSLAEMARAVLDALRSGMLDADTEAALIEAASVRETAALLAISSSAAIPEFEPVEG